MLGGKILAILLLGSLGLVVFKKYAVWILFIIIIFVIFKWILNLYWDKKEGMR